MADEGANIVPIIALSGAIAIYVLSTLFFSIGIYRSYTAKKNCENEQSMFVPSVKCNGIDKNGNPYLYYPIRYSKKQNKTIRMS